MRRLRVCLHSCIIGGAPLSVTLAKSHMRRSALKIGVVTLGAVLAVLLILPLLHQGSYRVNAERQWILQTVQELLQTAPPSFPPSSGTNTSRKDPWWAHPNYLIFSNGWAAYKIHTIHDSDDVGDITVLRSSGGAFYCSREHYCVGITEWMEPSPHADEQIAAPSDLADFLQHYGRAQRWNAFALNHRLWCILSCPHLRGAKKPVSVWISTGDGTNRLTLFERRYQVSGSHVSWATHWFSNDCVAVDIYDYSDRSLGGAYPLTSRSNHLMSLSFRRDPQTGQFTDKK